MCDQIRQDTLYIMLYAVVTAMSLLASCYLLFRQGNAFAKDITPPRRLRRWTAAYFIAAALCHLWYLPTYFLTSPDDVMLSSLIAGLLDCMTVIPLTIVVLLVMLQDRRRPLWPVAVMVAPLIAGLAWCVATRNEAILPMLYAYILLMWLGLIIYMVRATRQYGRWLRDNYADLEHKEVWQSFVVLAIILLTYAIYMLDAGELIYEFAMEVINIVLICYLLWRVETLSDLSTSSESKDDDDLSSSKGLSQTNRERSTLGTLPVKNIGTLLKQYCEEPQLYLQHDLTLLQLAKAVGTNRFYLSQYFSSQGLTYNAYINNLRIDHFVSSYREAVGAQRPFTAQQLAQESGYRSYSTFCRVIKGKTGKSVSVWIKTLGES